VIAMSTRMHTCPTCKEEWYCDGCEVSDAVKVCGGCRSLPVHRLPAPVLPVSTAMLEAYDRLESSGGAVLARLSGAGAERRYHVEKAANAGDDEIAVGRLESVAGELERLRARVAGLEVERDVLRGTECEANGDGPCGACVKCLVRWRKRAEAAEAEMARLKRRADAERAYRVASEAYARHMGAWEYDALNAATRALLAEGGVT